MSMGYMFARILFYCDTEVLHSLIAALGEKGLYQSSLCSTFYPTALKGCRGIVFTHGVRMGG